MDGWISPEVALAFDSPTFRAKVGWIGTFGDDVDGHALQLGLTWAF